MSYEGDLATHYNDIHKKLIGSPPIAQIAPPLARQPSSHIKEPDTFLLRLQALEERVASLENQAKTHVKLDNVVIMYPQFPQGKDRSLREIFKLVRNNEQLLDRSIELSTLELLGPKRHKTLTHVRHIMYYLMATTTTKSLPEIGKFLKRDHTSVMHGRDKVAALRKTDPMLDLKLRWYEAEIARLWAVRNVHNSVKSGDENKVILTEAAEAP